MLTVKYEIVHDPLENPPRYIAISYAWGEAGDMQVIQVDGSSIRLLRVSWCLEGAASNVGGCDGATRCTLC